MSTWKFHLLTFGCKVNQYESQALREAWQRQGGEECDDPALADIVCVNSCAITAKGERDARAALLRLRRIAPQARLVLTGCAAQLAGVLAPVRRRGAQQPQPTADLIIPQADKARLLDALLPSLATDGQQAPQDMTTSSVQGFPPFAIDGFRRARPVLKVQDGCEHRCTYCIVPLTRGRCRSREPQAILAEARRLLRAGHAEIMISGINLRQYGRDKPEFGDFWSLLVWLDQQLAPEFAGKARLRISSLEPGQLDSRGVDSLLSCRLVCPHLHISLQHASHQVLRRMGRGHYRAEALQQAVQALSVHWPVMGLGADIILGFPGETEADVDCLLDFVAATPFSYAHVFPYSSRPGTAAAGFAGHIAPQEKQERARRVRDAVARQQEAFRRAQLALPAMLLAADVADGQEKQRRTTGIRGVNEFYVPCRLVAPVPAMPLSGLVPVRPTGLDASGLLVEPVETPDAIR
ncbi:MiaB/RimO family radical SAM methylthiotransferase [uncultured Desulfovibrio sp.]|uniref:MiaB/RimO family radical SAM methylthiotransferase n=1 Tax=uncultured Desulfovibrio sp. TaxID=167968 RepID=UPI00261B84E9|nr:MiaB/RimO family radical SAM methylthiotransferase [uncultured Desulfovibrio sp.]